MYYNRKGIMMPREQRTAGAVLQIDRANLAKTARDNLTAAYDLTLKHRRIFKLTMTSD